MKNIKNLINGFFKRAGSFVFFATFIARISSFLTHLIILKLITKDNLGVIIYSLSFIAFILPISGLGVNQSFIRYGALMKSNINKEALFIYSLKKGGIATLLLIGFLYILINIFTFKFPNTVFYFRILLFSVLTHFLLSLIKTYFRLHHQNKQYAIIEITYSVLFLIIASISTYYYKEMGYVLSIIFVPLLVFLLFINKLNINFNNIVKLKITNIEFWRYGFFAGLANVATVLLVEIDNILIGDLLENPNEITMYKYITLIPLSLLFLPRVLITTDFVFLTEQIKDKKYIINYIKSYFNIFITVSIGILFISFLFGESVLSLFGTEFIPYKSTFLILIFGVTGILTLRGLFGNLLSSIGKAHLNFIIIVIALIINVISNHYFIPKYGILGASITSAIIMWITSFSTLILFYIYYKKFLKHD